MPHDQPGHGDTPAEPDEQADQRRFVGQPTEPVAELPEKDWVEDARRVYGPIDENTPTWHGRDAEGRDITGSGRPDLSPEEVDAHHLAEDLREAAQIREGIEWSVPYSKDTLQWVANVEAEASAAAQPPGAGSEKASHHSSDHGDETGQVDDEGKPDVADGTIDAVDQPPAAMPLDEDGRPAFRTEDYRRWYRECDDTGDAPGPYEAPWDEQLSEWRKGAKVEGFLVRSDNDESLMGDKPFKAGYEGPAKSFHASELGLGDDWANLSHVETHAAATMRLRSDETNEATLYLSKRPCVGVYGCMENFDRMLPEGAKVTAYWPGNYGVFIGKPDEPRNEE